MELSTGQMADLNCVSKKTLRVYHEQGLLEPMRIDEENGYRFYDLDQCSTIDIIQQLQGMGLSLTEIKELLDNKSIDGLIAAIERHLNQVHQEKQRIELSQHNAECLLRNCQVIKNKPLYDTIIIEHIALRRILRFPILHEGARTLNKDAAAYLPEWEMNLRLTKMHMLELGLPLELFHNVGCCISRENLRKGKLVLDSSFIPIKFERVANRFDAEVLPECDYLTLYKSSYTEGNADNSEVTGINAMLAYIEASHLEIAGDYYGEIIADTPAFLYEGREMLYKLQIPIKRKSDEGDWSPRE